MDNKHPLIHLERREASASSTYILRKHGYHLFLFIFLSLSSLEVSDHRSMSLQTAWVPSQPPLVFLLHLQG